MKKLAKVIRIATIPPIMATLFLLLVFFLTQNVFHYTYEFVLSILFIAIIPILIYPISLAIPKLKSKGREWQRKMAIYISTVSYLGLVIYLLFATGSEGLWTIALTYFFSGFGLLIFDLFKIKASGHSCAIIGPICASIYFFGVLGLIGLIIPIGVFWASVYLKSHTKKELLFGGMVSALAFCLSLGIIALL